MGGMMGGQMTQQDYNMQALWTAQQIKIRQQINVIEAVTDCEAKNKYDISAIGSPNVVSVNPEPKVLINESSECVERICCKSQRSLTFHLRQDDQKNGPIEIDMQKPCHIHGCWFESFRPRFTVRDQRKGGIEIGTVRDPCNCCKVHQDVYDASGQKRYEVDATCWQLGLFCSVCFEANFDILSGDGGSPVGKVTKRVGGLQDLCAQANTFDIDMPPTATVDDRKLLLAATMLLDIEYFEKAGGK